MHKVTLKMGIKGLKSTIKKNAPESIKIVNLKNLSGSTVCIDSSILMYRFRFKYSTDNFHIIGFLNKIIELLTIGIIPIFIFDGKPPDAKDDTIQKRIDIRNKKKEKLDSIVSSGSDNEIEITRLKKNILSVSKSHSDEIKILMKSIGIPFITAPGEAEEYCAFLQKNGIADYILTEDTDSLTFGGSSVLFEVPKRRNYFELFNLKTALTLLEINYQEFIDFCILSGCDYTCKVPKVDSAGALKIIRKYKNIENFVENNKKYIIPENFNYVQARKLFNQNNNYTLPEKFTIGTSETFNIQKFRDILIKNQINNIEYFVNKINNLI
jgi:flap endonuclease-1